jgi:hypothetical protein
MIIPYKPKIVSALLFAVLAMTAFSLFFFNRIDNLVNIDLYHYGLAFDSGWADPYWTNSNFYLYCQALTLILFGNSIAFFLNHVKNQRTFSSFASSALLFAGGGLDLIAIYFIFKLNSIVNHDLYSYGLSFSDEWYTAFSSNYNLMLLLVVLGGLLALVTAIIVYGSTRGVRIVPLKLLNPVLIANGTAAIALSIIYSSSTLAIIGLGLLFWGITFAYVGIDENIKRVILDTSVSSQMMTLSRMLKTLGFGGNPIYLPPGYFGNSSTYGVYVQKSGAAVLPAPKMIPPSELEFLFEFIENPPAVLMTPPGAELAQLFEKTLKTNFNRVDLTYLENNLPKLIVEELEIAESFEMVTKNDKVRVKIVGSAYDNPNAERQLPSVWSLFGSPLTSAIACSIAKAAGKPVMRAGSKIDSSDKPIIVEYIIIQIAFRKFPEFSESMAQKTSVKP